MNLLVDIGNSRIKWAVHDAGGLDSPRAAHYTDSDLPYVFDQEWNDLAAPERVLVSNVAGAEAAGRLSRWTADHWRIAPEFAAVTEEACGVKNGYEDINQLGIDRWLAVIAAWNRYRRAACLVDCGSAITIDSLDNNGVYLGGMILPGMEMMKHALYSRARGIRRGETIAKASPAFAQNTDQGIANGCLMAIVALIDRVARDMENEYSGEVACLITGGDAEKIRAHLSLAFNHEPNLVLEGLQLCLGGEA